MIGSAKKNNSKKFIKNVLGTQFNRKFFLHLALSKKKLFFARYSIIVFQPKM